MRLREVRHRLDRHQTVGIDPADQQVDALVDERELDAGGAPVGQQSCEQPAHRCQQREQLGAQDPAFGEVDDAPAARLVEAEQDALAAALGA